MDVTQVNLKNLLHVTDKAYEMAIQHPSSAIYLAKYELAKRASENYLFSMRQSLPKKAKSR